MAAVLWYAQHSNGMLTRLLGIRYTFDDVIFYLMTIFATLVLSNAPAMRPARLPILGEAFADLKRLQYHMQEVPGSKCYDEALTSSDGYRPYVGDNLQTPSLKQGQK